MAIDVLPTTVISHCITKFSDADIHRLTAAVKPYLMHSVTTLCIASTARPPRQGFSQMTDPVLFRFTPWHRPLSPHTRRYPHQA
jgi:hypothetical protein